MSKDEILYFIGWDLEWLILPGNEKQVQEAKKELGLM